MTETKELRTEAFKILNGYIKMLYGNTDSRVRNIVRDSLTIKIAASNTEKLHEYIEFMDNQCQMHIMRKLAS